MNNMYHDKNLIEKDMMHSFSWVATVVLNVRLMYAENDRRNAALFLLSLQSVLFVFFEKMDQVLRTSCHIHLLEL